MVGAPTRAHLGALGWVTLLASLLLTGCASLGDFAGSGREPLRGDRFAVPQEGTDVVGAVQVVVARQEDTLPDFARRYGLGHDEIVAANPGVDPWLPGSGTRVVLPTQFVLPDAPREGIVVNLATKRLFYYPKRKAAGPREVLTYPIGIGREGWRTPLGRMQIAQKIKGPTWVPPASIRREHAQRGDILPAVVRAGPDNPLGAYAMRLSRPSYLIHGTNKPFGIGMRVSHGCMQLYPEDIAELFPQVPVGTRVTIVNQPYLAGWKGEELYLEAHSPLAEEAKRLKGSLKPVEKVLKSRAEGDPTAVDWTRAQEVAREARGIPVPVSPGSADLHDLLARAPRVPRIPPWEAPARGEG